MTVSVKLRYSNLTLPQASDAVTIHTFTELEAVLDCNTCMKDAN